MIALVLTLVAGWYRSKTAAAVIAVISFLIQVLVVLPAVTENRRLLGLSTGETTDALAIAGAAVEIAVLAVILYFAGSGARALWGRWRSRSGQGSTPH